MNSNLVNLIPQFFDSSGNPLNGGTLNTYVAGTSTPLATYPTNTDAIAGTNANSTAISINTSGYPSASTVIIGVFLKPGKQYKFILKDSSGITIYTLDNISNLIDAFYDANGNEVIKLVGVASAINEITVTNAATGNNPIIAASGDDTDIGLTIKTKGTGSLSLLDGSNNELIKLNTVGSAVNEISTTNAISTASPTISATGDDTNIAITVKGKGTGDVNIGQATSVNTAITSSNIKLVSDQPIVDSSGNELIKFTKTTTAVNELTIANAATATNPLFSATGSDTNIGLNFQAKGTGVYNFLSTALQGSKVQLWDATGGVDNYLQLKCPDTLSSNRVVTFPDADLDFNPVYFSRGDAAGTSLPDNTEVKIPLATALYDNKSYWDGTNKRFIPAIVGVYQISAMVTTVATTDGGRVVARIKKNGAIVYENNNRNSGSASCGASVSGILTMNGSTDYIELFGLSSAGGTSTTSDATLTYMTIHRISGL